MPVPPAERVRAYRQRRKDAGEPDSTRRNRAAERIAWKARQPGKLKPFVGCDGEGAGVDDLGRQNYLLFRMGERELYANGERLTTEALLDFICDEPPGSILVGFAFGYDVTMILRDLPVSQQKRLFEPHVFGEGKSPYVWFRDFDIIYLPRNYLKVRRVNVVRDVEGNEKRVPIKGSQRTIFETFGFFQKSFLKVLHEFDVGTPAERERIAANKARRGDFGTIDAEERAYCALECVFLAELMTKLRDYCEEAGIRPRSWSGAGKLASALHAKHKTIKGADVVAPPEVLTLAQMAYYGGRFEVTRTGMISGKVWEYDIKSAYPDEMRYLPCLEHGTWRHASGSECRSSDGLFVCGVSFNRRGVGDRLGDLGGLPIRSKEGHLYWPMQGSGIYWSPEIKSAVNLGFDVRYKEGWIYEKRCDCQPFDWVEPLYDYRRSIGSSGPGYPIKLGINSLYGKLAQRKGNGSYHNMIWAGLITALTRARLNEAVAMNPGRIVMLATDAIYSLDPLPELELGEWLGAWDRTEMDGLFIVQPGLYWSPERRKKKSRGLSESFFEGNGLTEKFEHAWEDFAAAGNSGLEVKFPAVSVPVPGFIGLKLALARNKPELAGTWVREDRSISFDYRNKRVGHVWTDGHIVTKPKLGGPRCVSLPHREFLAAGGAEPWEMARLMLEEQPDYVDLSAPFKD